MRGFIAVIVALGCSILLWSVGAHGMAAIGFPLAIAAVYKGLGESAKQRAEVDVRFEADSKIAAGKKPISCRREPRGDEIK